MAKRTKFHTVVSDAMDRQNVGLNELSSAVGVPIGTLFNWVRGRTAPGPKSMKKVGAVCAYLSINPRQVLNL